MAEQPEVMLTLIEHGDLLAPQARGQQSVLLGESRVLKVGAVDGGGLAALGVPCQTVDACGCWVLPGLIDPHVHLLGAGGEEGFGSRTQEVMLDQLLQAGITTAIGLLGTDTTTRHLTSLLAKVRQLDAAGLTAYMYTGGFQVPGPSLFESVMDDLVLIDKVIGVGEVAISDVRSVEPTLDDLAKLVSYATLGGMVGGKAGVVHFHVGPGKRRLGLLHELLDKHEIAPDRLYPTHCNRTPELLDDAIALAGQGAYVDIDTSDGDLGKWLLYYRDHDGPAGRLTVSSDGHAIGDTLGLYEQFVASVQKHGLAVESIVPYFSLNTARALKLEQKARLEAGGDADVLVLRKDTLEIAHVFARGRQLVKDGRVCASDRPEE